jgi:hypothetical protein
VRKKRKREKEPALEWSDHHFKRFLNTDKNDRMKLRRRECLSVAPVGMNDD